MFSFFLDVLSLVLVRLFTSFLLDQFIDESKTQSLLIKFSDMFILYNCLFLFKNMENFNEFIFCKLLKKKWQFQQVYISYIWSSSWVATDS